MTGGEISKMFRHFQDGSSVKELASLASSIKMKPSTVLVPLDEWVNWTTTCFEMETTEFVELWLIDRYKASVSYSSVSKHSPTWSPAFLIIAEQFYSNSPHRQGAVSRYGSRIHFHRGRWKGLSAS